MLNFLNFPGGSRRFQFSIANLYGLTLGLLTLVFAANATRAQTLLYYWNFNNSTGSGSTLTTPPAYTDTSDGYTGGTLVVAANAAAGLATPAGSGLSNAWTNELADLALLNPTTYRSAAGVYQAPVGNLGGVSNSFTVTLWFNYNATVTNFSSLNGGALNARLMDINSGSLQDGDELYFSMNSGNGIQVGVNSSTSTGPVASGLFGTLGASPQAMTNNWFFVAISYTNTGGGTVNIYIGTTNSVATLASTLTAVGSLPWSSSTNYILVGNRGAGDRGLPGSIDNLRIFNGAGNLQFIDNVQAADLSPASSGINVTWVGNAGTNWDSSTFNWMYSGVSTNYADGDFVLFNDAATVSAINVATNVSPGSVTVSNNALAYVFSGSGGIEGSGGLTKLGTNTLTLDGSNAYSGATTISNGTLLVGGNISGAGSVSVSTNATLGGTGTIAGAVTIQSGANFAPGAGAGAAAKLTLSNNLTLLSGSFTTMRVQTGSIEDQAVNGGMVTYGGTLTVTNVGGALVAGDTFKLFTAASYTGSFAITNLPALGNNLIWINTLSNNGTLAVAAISTAVVTNLPAGNVQGTFATLNGQVVSIGSQTPTITLYYGPIDGGTNAVAWSHSVVLGVQGGSFSYVITGLSTNTTYYYAAAASNVVGNVWATPSQSFTTLATNAALAQQTQIQYLSGTDKNNTVPWQFSVSSGRLAGIATNIPVPSCWPSLGYGTFSYTQNGGGIVTSSNAETGFYTNTFAVPSAWAGMKIFLVFEGVMTDTSVSINGQLVGPIHQGAYYEFQYDVTPYVVVGASTNVLQVTVRKFSANGSVEAAEEGNTDYWIFAGIFRPVYLEAKPLTYIDYVAANPLANGNITVSAYLGGITNNFSVQAFVTDTNNVMLGNVFSNSVSAGMTNVVLSASLPTPNAWSSESPTLYTLNVQLVDTNGVVVHSVTNQIGFRTVTFVANQGFFINGNKVVMRGICHHEEWPTTGRTSSDAQSSNDVAMIKDMNFNAVRESHYPEDKTFLQECDRQGLYILEEMDSYQTDIDVTDGVTHIYEMIRRDVNDPCIIAWDNGNEANWGSGSTLASLDGGNAGSTNYYDLYDVQDRQVIRPGVNATFENLFDQHYPVYSTLTNNLGTGKTAYSCTEILHAIYDGGGGASLQEYWDAMRTAANGVGMFLWSWDDEGVVTNLTTGQISVQGQSAPDGIVGPYRQKEASYYTYKRIYSPVQIGSPNPATFAGTLPFTNRFNFTDLDQCTFDWQLGWWPDPDDPTNTYGTNALAGGFLLGVDGGNFTVPSLAPGNSGSLALPSFPANWTNYDALRFTATDPYGNNIYTWTWPLSTPIQIRNRILGSVSTGAPAITVGTSATEIIVTNGPRTFHFSNTTGVLNSLTVSNLPVSFNNGPAPVAGSAWAINSFTNYSDGTNYYIGVNSLNSQTNAFLWMICPDGWVTLSYQYWLSGLQPFMGITFNYPSNNVTGMNWLGQGPYRVYKNRLLGQEIFTHTKPYNYTWTGMNTNYDGYDGTEWVYPEFEGYHGQFYWATLQTTEQPITMVTPTTNLFFRVLTPPPTDIANVNPPYPSGGISFLHGIPPNGNKFDVATNDGPAGQTNLATGLYTGEVDFFFGTPPPSGADRDANGLMDSWELQYFGSLGQNPDSTADVDGQPLEVECAFNLSPFVSNSGLSILPGSSPGSFTPVALTYSVPTAQLNFYNFVPRISGDLINWYGADLYPQYFLINSIPNGTFQSYSIEANLANLPFNTNTVFLNLEIEEISP
ncbi:MAG: glycoside hydrolase family 2 TIM barrel-domain containing protein [Verrucomicrobiota bacterium]